MHQRKQQRLPNRGYCLCTSVLATEATQQRLLPMHQRTSNRGYCLCTSVLATEATAYAPAY